MPQTKYDHTVADKDAAKELVANTETIKGVKFVNVSTDFSAVVVTHGEDYDEAAFKEAIGIS